MLAEENPNAYHGVKPGMVVPESDFSKAAGEVLCELAERDSRVCAITAAMTDGTGLRTFSERFPSRFFDVGIAEEHAATFSAGLADGGLKPYFAVYSTFLQRAYDQVMLDCCVNALPVTLLVDRAGLTGNDGITHQGIFDVGFLTQIPNLTVLCPRDIQTLKSMLAGSLTFGRPLAIRYGNSYLGELGGAVGNPFQWDYLRRGSAGTILTYSNRLLHLAVELAESLHGEGIALSVADASCLKPIDEGFLQKCAGPLLIIEDSVARGSLGEAVTAYCADCRLPVNIRRCCIGDKFVAHGTVDEQLVAVGLSKDSLLEELRALCG